MSEVRKLNEARRLDSLFRSEMPIKIYKLYTHALLETCSNYNVERLEPLRVTYTVRVYMCPEMRAHYSRNTDIAHSCDDHVEFNQEQLSMRVRPTIFNA